MTAKNYVLGKTGIMRYSKSKSYARRARYRYAQPGKKTVERPAPRPKFVEKKIGGEKNGGTRMVPVHRNPKSYEAQTLPKKLPNRQRRFRDQKRFLRNSITPGTVLILVAGPHRGKRVVFLKQLGTGLLLITGPFVLNRCPMRRINQRYVIATKTKIDISEVEIPKEINDQYFKKPRVKKGPKPAEGDIFEKKKQHYMMTDEKKKDQLAVDRQIIAAIRKREDKKLMLGYLMMHFKLDNHSFPHKMVF